MSQELDGLLQEACAAACARERGTALLRSHLWAVLLSPERATLTNLLCTNGRQQADWSADYRLYSQGRAEPRALLATALEEVLAVLPAAAPLVLALDDTLLRKTGTHINGVGWRRDPLGPPFQTNLVRAQRFIQFSAAWPGADGSARMVPVAFEHAPSVPKPGKRATDDQLATYRQECRRQNLTRQGLGHMAALRAQVPPERHVIFAGDGSYTNATIIKQLPEGCTYIGRMRKDAVLHFLPTAEEAKATGRRRVYGKLAPTPEALRTDEARPWQKVEAFAAGRRHQFKIRTLEGVQWRKGGAAQVRIVVIAPLGYRLRNGSKMLYRQPAYLICTAPELPLEEVLQYYLWRWGIEVNFREEKTILGAGQAQVRVATSAQAVPAMVVAAYSLLWVAALRLHQKGQLPPGLHPPKWRKRTSAPTHAQLEPPPTGTLIRTLRCEIWSRSLRPASLCHFAHINTPNAKCHKLPHKPSNMRPCLPATLFAAA